MKYKILTIAVLLSAVACKKTEAVTTSDETAKPITRNECYQMVNANDTVILSITENSNNVNGLLTYKLREKDSNHGTISGIFTGDTLFADYTFESEGMTSVREAAFVKKGNTLIQGSGEMEERNNKLCFKNAKALDYNGPIVLEKTNCN